MKKNKLSIIFAILTCVCIFSVTAIVDQCGCRAVPLEEKVDVDEERVVEEAEAAVEEVEEEKEVPHAEEEEEPSGEDVEEEEEEQPVQE